MVNLGLLVKLEAKPGKEQEVEDFIKGALPLAEAEPATSTWFAIKINESNFAIFDTFPNEEARTAHLKGQIAEALMAKAPELLIKVPVIEHVEILASKLPS